MKVLSLSPGPAGLPGVIVIRPQSMIQYIIGLSIAFVVAFIATIILSKFWGENKLKEGVN